MRLRMYSGRMTLVMNGCDDWEVRGFDKFDAQATDCGAELQLLVATESHPISFLPGDP